MINKWWHSEEQKLSSSLSLFHSLSLTFSLLSLTHSFFSSPDKSQVRLIEKRLKFKVSVLNRKRDFCLPFKRAEKFELWSESHFELEEKWKEKTKKKDETGKNGRKNFCPNDAVSRRHYFEFFRKFPKPTIFLPFLLLSPSFFILSICLSFFILLSPSFFILSFCISSSLSFEEGFTDHCPLTRRWRIPQKFLNSISVMRDKRWRHKIVKNTNLFKNFFVCNQKMCMAKKWF